MLLMSCQMVPDTVSSHPDKMNECMLHVLATLQLEQRLDLPSVHTAQVFLHESTAYLLCPSIKP